MATIQLLPGESRPILSDNNRSRKSVFVKCISNWPAPAGEPEPSIPLDLNIIMQVSYGQLYSEWTTPLATAGTRIDVTSDKLVVIVRYDGHGLGVPFANYIVNASLVDPPLSDRPVLFRYTNKVTTMGTIPAARQPIPDYAQEVRINSNMLGAITIEGYQTVSDGVERQYMSFEECTQWRLIEPFAATWRMVNTSLPEDYPNPGFVTLEFR